MILVGITGGIGSGKSTVARILEQMGFPVFYSDKEAARLMDVDPEIREFLRRLTGENMHVNERLDRKKLAARLFNNKEWLSAVNAFVHPLVRKNFDEWASHQHAQVVFNEAAILIETGSHERFGQLVLVTAPTEIRIERAMLRDQSTREEVLNRMANQWSDERKVPFADVIIRNDGSPILFQIERFVDYLLNR
jgi:dephospho-CoA kinase